MFKTQKQIILASHSPRRQQFFKDLGIDFSLLNTTSNNHTLSSKNIEIAKRGVLGCNDTEERPSVNESPIMYACRMANKKAINAVFSFYNVIETEYCIQKVENIFCHEKDLQLSYPIKQYELPFLKDLEEKIFLSADTIVCLGNEILGKPKSHEEALTMLRSLVGRSHLVITAVSIINTKEKILYSFYDQTKVNFMPWSISLLKAYIKTGESFDKAGAYGISGLGCFLSDSIQGSWDTVVGLPIAKCIEFLLWNNVIQVTEEEI